LAKGILTSLLNDQTLKYMRVRAFTLMPDHLHLLAGVRLPESDLPTLLGGFKSYTTQLYWKRGREVMESLKIYLPSELVEKTDPNDAKQLLAAVMEWRATLRPERLN